MNFLVSICLFFYVTASLIGDYFTGKIGETQKLYFGVIAVLVYSIGAIVWVIAVKNGISLGRASVLFATSSAIAGVVIDMIFFHNPISTLQWIGIIFGIIGLYLIVS